MSLKQEIKVIEKLIDDDIMVLEIWKNEQKWYGGQMTEYEIKKRIEAESEKLYYLKQQLK